MAGLRPVALGRAHGRLGLEEMVRVKYLDIDRLPGMKKVWWYPYGDTICAADGGIHPYAVCAEGRSAAAWGAASGRCHGAPKIVIPALRSSFICARTGCPRDRRRDAVATFVSGRMRVLMPTPAARAACMRCSLWRPVKPQFRTPCRSFPNTKSKSKRWGNAPATRKTRRESFAAGI